MFVACDVVDCRLWAELAYVCQVVQIRSESFLVVAAGYRRLVELACKTVLALLLRYLIAGLMTL